MGTGARPGPKPGGEHSQAGSIVMRGVEPGRERSQGGRSQATLPRNDLLSRLYWGTQWTMEIS